MSNQQNARLKCVSELKANTNSLPHYLTNSLTHYLTISLKSWQIGLTLLLSLAFACSYPEGYEKIEVDGKYSIDVPAFMDEADDLAPDASLQYKNPFRNVYLIVLEANRDDFIDLGDFQEQATSRILEDPLLKEPTVEDEKEIDVNGHPGILTSIFGTMDENEIIFYKHLSVDGGDSYYEVVFWLRGEKRRLEYESTIDSVMNSFQIL